MEVKTRLYVAYSTLVVLVILRIISFFFTELRLWAFNHNIFLPDYLNLILALLAITALILPLLKYSEMLLDHISNQFNSVFFESKNRYLLRVIFIAVFTILFIQFLAPTHFLGDGYTILGNIASESGTFYKWSEIGITIILTSLQSLFGGKNESNALLAFQAVSIFSGIITIWFYFLIAGLLTGDIIKRFLLLIIMLFAGNLLLFFGYVENYPLLWIAFSGFYYFSIRFLKTNKGLYLSLLFLLLGILIHVQFGILLPAFVFVILNSGKGRLFYRGNKRSIWIVIIILLIVGLFALIHKYKTDLYFENIFLPLLEGKIYQSYYTIFSPAHLIDIINLLNLLSPAVLIFAAAAIGKKVLLSMDKTTAFSGLVSITFLLFLLVVDPKLGMPRDWDLFSLAAMPVTIFFILTIRQSVFDSLRRIYPSIVLIIIISVFPFLYTHLNTDTSIDYIKYISNYEKKGSLYSLIILREYFNKSNDQKKTDSLQTLIYNRFPNEAKIKEASDAISRGEIDRAFRMLSDIKPNRFSNTYHSVLSGIYFYQNKPDSALIEMKKAVQLQKYNATQYYNLSYIYATLNQFDKAIESLLEAYSLDSDNHNILISLAQIYLANNHPEKALDFSEKLLIIDEGKVEGYYLLAKIYAQKGQFTEVRHYLDLYLKYGASQPGYNERSEELLELLKK